ncbi:hypothetical protein Tco_0643818 [Tanacetum coccineum]
MNTAGALVNPKGITWNCSCISDRGSLYGDRATGAALDTKSIQNSTCRVGGSPGKSSRKTSIKSHTIVGMMSIKELKVVDTKL